MPNPNSPLRMVFAATKKEIRSELSSMDALFGYADAMVRTIEQYDNPHPRRPDSASSEVIDALPDRG